MDARGLQQMFSQERPLRCFEKRHQQGVLALAQRDWFFIETYQSSAAMLEPRAIESVAVQNHWFERYLPSPFAAGWHERVRAIP